MEDSMGNESSRTPATMAPTYRCANRESPRGSEKGQYILLDVYAYFMLCSMYMKRFIMYSMYVYY